MRFVITDSFSLKNIQHKHGGRTFSIIPITADAARNLVINERATPCFADPNIAGAAATFLGFSEKAEEWAHSSNQSPLIGPIRYPEMGAPISLIVVHKDDFYQVYEVDE